MTDPVVAQESAAPAAPQAATLLPTAGTHDPAPINAPADIDALVAKLKRSKPAAAATQAAPAEPAQAPVVETAAAAALESVEAKTPEAAPAVPAPDDKAAAKAKRDAELSELARATRERRLAAESARRRESDLAQRDAELAKERELLELAKKDPLAFLEKTGLPPEKLAERVIKKGSPDEAARIAMERLEALEKQIAARDQAERQRIQQEYARQSDQSFVERVTSDPSKYEALNALYDPQDILFAAKAFVARVSREEPGRTYTDSQIADILEAAVAKKFAGIKERYAAAPKSEAKTQSPPQAQEQGPVTKTLTSELQSEASTPKDWKSLPPKKQNEYWAEKLRAMSRKSA